MDRSMTPGQFEPPARTGGGAHADGSRPRRRLPGRKRWFVAAGVLAAFTGMVAPPAQSRGPRRGGSRGRLRGAAHPRRPVGHPRPLGGSATRGHHADGGARAGPRAAGRPGIRRHRPGGQRHPQRRPQRLPGRRRPHGDGEAECGIDWSLLAGIGRVESNHGRYGGAVLGLRRLGDPEDPRPGPGRRAVRLHRRQRRRPGGTTTPPTTAPWARCSSSRPRGAPTRSTPTATA